MPKHWTRERIIRQLLEREAKGLPLNASRDGVDSSLYQAAGRIFGSWRNAIQAAGITPERAMTRNRWPPAKVLMTIRQLARRGRPLSGQQMDRRYGSMMAAARRLYGSWTKAVLAAGVDPTRLQRVVPWNQDRIIQAILTRVLRNEPLAPRSVEPRSLVEAGGRLFGSWAAAVAAAGLEPKTFLSRPVRPKEPNPPRVRVPCPRSPHSAGQPWTKELVIAAIQARLHAGKRMNAWSVSHENPGLYRAARRHLKTWNNALLAAGLNPDAHRAVFWRKDPSGVPAVKPPVTRESQPKDGLRPDRPA